MFQQTLEIKEALTFVLYVGVPADNFVLNCIHVLTMVAAFQVILEAEEDDKRQKLKN